MNYTHSFQQAANIGLVSHRQSHSKTLGHAYQRRGKLEQLDKGYKEAFMRNDKRSL